MTTTFLRVEGMSCQNCVRHVRQALEGVAHVTSARVDLDGARAEVRWQDGPREDDLLGALQAAGYPGQVVRESAAPASAGSSWKFNVIFGSVITAPLLLAECGFGLDHFRWFAWASFLAVLPLQILGGWRFYRGAWQQLKVGQSNMDTLVALGSTTAFLFSVDHLFWPVRGGHTYFMEAAAIITLISVGHWLEAIAGSQAAQAVRKLLVLAPASARRLRPDGSEEDVPVASLRMFDRLVLRPGDRVPVDGIVLEGTSAVDESMLTGESTPVEKTVGGRLYTGTINTNGRLLCEVTTTGASTALAQIIAVVERAQNSRADVQRLADRISSIFVPCVVLCALATVLVWGLRWNAWETGIICAVSVLIVACPCAMGLATPAAIMAASNAGAKRGILIRDGVALEKTGKITSILFDKTGTLTLGKPVVQDPPHFLEDRSQALALVKAMAQPSRHPLSVSLAAFAGAVPPVMVEKWREEPGRGVVAQWDGRTVRLGALAWLESFKVTPAGRLDMAGQSALGLAVDQTLWAVFTLRDQLKPNARTVLDELRHLGLDVFLVSGDRSGAARDVAQQLGINEAHVFSELRPDGKVGVIQDLQARGQRVAFVGDGINDAPALSQADLGIAVSLASDVAKESADIIVLKADLEVVPEALRLSRRTLLTIRQNLFWAFFYNVAAIPVAAMGFASPILCAAAMGLSDLFLIANSLRLLVSPAKAVGLRSGKPD